MEPGKIAVIMAVVLCIVLYLALTVGNDDLELGFSKWIILGLLVLAGILLLVLIL